jgi:hypothetical protein
MISLTLQDKCGLMVAEIEYSDEYEKLLEDGGDDFLLQKFNEAISILTIRAKAKESFEDFSVDELDTLALVFGLMEELEWD